jgi:hypothetical protein
MQCPFSIRHTVLPDVNCQLKGFDDDVDVFLYAKPINRLLALEEWFVKPKNMLFGHVRVI